MRRMMIFAGLLFLGLPSQVDAQACGPASSANAQNCTSITIGSITWTFSATYTGGKYATGDWWVTNPGGGTVSISGISPAYFFNSADSSYRNGSMRNPQSSANGFPQGFDSRACDSSGCQSTNGNSYNAGLNVGITMPLVITEGASLLSSESYGTNVRPAQHQSFSKQIQVLTVLTGNATVGDLRPPYQNGTSKTSPGNISTFDYSKFHTVVPPASFTSTYSTAYLDSIMLEPQIELEMSTKGRYLHPGDNYNPKVGPVSDYGYGQNIGMAHGVLMLALQGNYSNAQKQPWLIHLVQAGIDLYGGLSTAAGIPSHGIIMIAGGSHTPGKMFSVTIAGVQLNNATILSWGNNVTHPVSNEKNQYKFITSQMINSTQHGANTCTVAQYPASSLGTAEWVSDDTDPLSGNWNMGCYRGQVAQATFSQVLAGKMMNIKTLVNNPPLFEYYENRYITQLNGLGQAGTSNNIYGWQRDYWNAYNSIGPPTGGSPPTNVVPTISSTTAPNLETTGLTATLTATYADSDGTVSSVGWARTYPTTATGSCTLAAGTATCTGVGLVGAAANAFTLTATDNLGATATATTQVLRRTCPSTPQDTFTVDGSWPTLGPCYTPMTTNVMSIGGNQAAATAATTRHLAAMAWSGGAPDDYKVQIRATSQVTEVSLLLFGCFSSMTAVGSYDGYVMSMQGLGTNLARYDAGVRSTLMANTLPADGGWIAGETGTLECVDNGTDTTITAKDQNGVTIGAPYVDSTAGRKNSGEAFVGSWGGATFDDFSASTIVGGPGPDTTPPTISVTLPVSNPATTNNIVYTGFTGVASDNVAVVSVTWQNLTNADTGPTAGTVNAWTIPVGSDLDLNADASNVIRITACDGATIPNCSSVDWTINHVTASTGAALIQDPGPAQVNPYFVRGDQINMRGACSNTPDHVEIWVGGAPVGPADVPVSSSFVSGTATWATIQPFPVGISQTANVSVEARCVRADTTYVSSTISILARNPPRR